MEHQVKQHHSMTNEEKKLLALIPTGSEQPRPLKELVQLTGWDQRKVRTMITRLIIFHHQPIGACYHRPGNGYFIITNNEERSAALAPLTSQIFVISQRAQVIGNVKLGNEE